MTFLIDTLGCKVNQYETQAMTTLLQERGHCLAASPELAQVRIVNTCAVTGESGCKSRQAVRRAKSESPEALIAVCGCFSQISPEQVADLGADVIGGSGDRSAFVKNVERAFRDRETFIREVDDPLHRRDFEVLPAGGLTGRTRAMLKIQDGCSNFCSYCVIPYARGPVRSMSLADVSAQSAALAEAGYREIVLTGIEISSYGRDLKGEASLIDAVRAVSQAAPGLRLRLGSLEPRTATPEFCRELAQIPGVCPHFHMSLQSGCTATLRRMRRRYTAEEYYGYIANLRASFPECAITTDVIVGFPGETEEEFCDTLAFLETCAFAGIHVFPYSPRPGTPAASMAGQIEKSVKHARAAEAGRLAKKLARQYAERFVGRSLEVLFEQAEPDGRYSGHTGNYLTVLASGDNLHNVVKTVQITGLDGSYLCGTVQGG